MRTPTAEVTMVFDALIQFPTGAIRLSQNCYECYSTPMKSRMITQREFRNQPAAVLREVEAGRTTADRRRAVSG